MPIELKLPELLQNLHGKEVMLKCGCGHCTIVGKFRAQPEEGGAQCAVELIPKDGNYALSCFKQSEVESVTIESGSNLPVVKLFNPIS